MGHKITRKRLLIQIAKAKKEVKFLRKLFGDSAKWAVLQWPKKGGCIDNCSS